jgi:hypothetical protein
MNDTTLENHVAGEVSAARAFAWWAELGTPYTAGTVLDDWVATGYKDVVCFQRFAGDNEAFLVGEGRVMHFGFDTDSLESAYEALGPKRGVSETTVVRRFPFRAR